MQQTISRLEGFGDGLGVKVNRTLVIPVHSWRYVAIEPLLLEDVQRQRCHNGDMRLSPRRVVEALSGYIDRPSRFCYRQRPPPFPPVAEPLGGKFRHRGIVDPEK